MLHCSRKTQLKKMILLHYFGKIDFWIMVMRKEIEIVLKGEEMEKKNENMMQQEKEDELLN